MLTVILILYFLWAAAMFLICIRAFGDIPQSGDKVKDTITKLIASAVIGIIWPVIALFILAILVHERMADYFNNTRH